MIQKLKYVVFEDISGFEHIIVTSPKLGTRHCDVMVRGSKPVSAGFVNLADKEPKCYGKSVSLKLKSREKEDEILFKMYFCGKEPIF